MMQKFAPVLIITLNRNEHFTTCVNSLLECDYSNKTDLIIALDYPLNDSHWEGYNKIQSFIKTISGFKSITVIKRDVNFGIQKNYFEAIDFVFKKHDRLIFTEDDNVFSIDFLNFMNQCLEFYENRSDIFSVNGYNYPINIPLNYSQNVYLWQGHSAWGSGFWREKFLKIDWSENVVHSNVNTFLNNYYAAYKLNRIANLYIPALVHMQNVNKIHGDVYISLYQFLNNLTSVFPVESRVRNIGNDGSGENCSALEGDIYSKQSIYMGNNEYNISNVICSSIIIVDLLKVHFKRSFHFQITTFFRLFLVNTGLYAKLKYFKSKV